MSSYSRLALVACKDPRSVSIVLTGNERALSVTSLGESEWLDVELESVAPNGNAANIRFRLSSDGEHEIPSGFSRVNISKCGSGSPTTVQLLHNA